jgi:hypothetical protein
MARKKAKSWTSSTGTTPADWGIKDPDASYQHGESQTVKSWMKKAQRVDYFKKDNDNVV